MNKKGVLHFFAYNNTVPIVLGILFLSTTATFAASPEVRGAVYSSTTTVQSIDNSYIIAANLEQYPFQMRITGITEDDDSYYVAYDFDTIDIVDGVWRDVTKREELRVYKSLLGSGDLQKYVESELAQVKAHEVARLTETQAYEKKIGISNKVVATAYAGLIGKFVDTSEIRVPQYESTVDPDDPLYVEHPVPLVSWDANQAPQEVLPRQEPSTPPDNNDHSTPPPQDVCPGIEGIQSDPAECTPPSDGGGGTDTPPDTGGDTPPPADTGNEQGADTGGDTEDTSNDTGGDTGTGDTGSDTAGGTSSGSGGDSGGGDGEGSSEGGGV